LQTHKHSKTCRKKGHPVCRFGFPLPPLRKTVVLEPLETEVEKYKEMHKKINSLHEFENINSMTFDDFLNDVLQTTEEEYIKNAKKQFKWPQCILEEETI